jgi:hypothetical protein
VKHWEIWNEPNIFFWQGPREMYATLLKRSYAALKEADPEAQVLGLSTAGIDNGYIKWMMELGAPFDVLTIHPYRTILDDAAFIADLKAVSDLVKLPGGRRRPVWLTEMGWATHVPHNSIPMDFRPNSQRTQAELIARSYLCSIVSGVEPRTFWYNFRNDGEDPLNFEHCMGILYRDFRPKPAYIAYSTLTRVLKGMKLAGAVPAPEGTFAFRFVGDAGSHRTVFCIWNPKADAVVGLEVGAAKVVRTNAVGETEDLVPAGTPKTVSVRVRKGASVYVIVD